MDLVWKESKSSKPRSSINTASIHTQHQSRTFRFMGSSQARKRAGRKPKTTKARCATRSGPAKYFSKFRLDSNVGNSPKRIDAVEEDAAASVPEVETNDCPRQEVEVIPWANNSFKEVEGSVDDIPIDEFTQYFPEIPGLMLDPSGISSSPAAPATPIDTEADNSSFTHGPETFGNEGSDDCLVEISRQPIPAGIKFTSLAHKYETILFLYDEEFCVVPLSADCHDNPFRIRRDRFEQFPFLLHATLAMSSQHLAKQNNSLVLANEVHNHWSTAIQLFSAALSNSSFLPLLDTLLILINFESTQSPYGMLDMHLQGARRMLQEADALLKCHRSSHLRAKVAMLIWWDVTASLISRKEPRLPSSYLEVLAKYEPSDSWSFFTLVGCPIEFVMAMARLAKLASIYEQTTQMESVIFDHRSVDTVIQQVQNYANEEEGYLDAMGDMEEDPNTARNRYHCIEAWRQAIQLYAIRVFDPILDRQDIQVAARLARITLDSARCIPSTDRFQKQLLLPVFLAGAEMGDEWNRCFVRDYCNHWSQSSRFDQFSGALVILEDIWAEWTPWTRNLHWWGVKVKRSYQANGYMDHELLLG